MAYYGNGSAFGGFNGGYNLAPGGIAPAFNPAAFGGAHTLGSNLPPVDPNNFPGTVHFGQPTTVVGQGFGQFPQPTLFPATNAAYYGGPYFNGGF